MWTARNGEDRIISSKEPVKPLEERILKETDWWYAAYRDSGFSDRESKGYYKAYDTVLKMLKQYDIKPKDAK